VIIKDNTINAKCIKSNMCQCALCEFNGKEICLGCNECIEHKLLAPVSNCSKVVKNGDWCGFFVVSVGDKYFMVVPMGICDVPEYFPIDKDEFTNFDKWKNDDKKIIESAYPLD